MCDELQGYLFSKPLPPHEFAALLASFAAAPCIPSVEAPPLAGDGQAYVAAESHPEPAPRQ
jgi:hypothetical protein